MYFPGAAQGKAWKFRRPYFGPYLIIALTQTNAEVRLVNQPDGGETLFVSLDRVRPCYSEMSDDVWTGHGSRSPKPKRKKQGNATATGIAEGVYTGPITRARSHQVN